MKGVKITPIVSLTLTPSEWDLYTKELAAPVAAFALNQVIEDSFNAGLTRSETTQKTFRVMDAYRRVGANDSEPNRVLERILNEIYG